MRRPRPPRPTAAIVPALAVVLALAVVAGCGRSGDAVEDAGIEAAPVAPTPAPAAVAGTVVVATDDEGRLAPILRVAAERHPRLEVTVRAVGALPLAAAVAADPPPDVVLVDRVAALQELAAEGLLSALPPELTSRVAEVFAGADGRWIVPSARARVVVAGRLVANRPRSITDLVNPRFRGKLARTSAEADPRFVDGLAPTIAGLGPRGSADLAIGLAANSADNVHAGDAAAVAAVAEHRADLALVDHPAFYAHVVGDEDDRADAERKVAESALRVVHPDAEGAGIPWSGPGAAVPEGAAHREQALALLEVLLSEPGQRAWAEVRREYPAVPGVAPPPGLPAIDPGAWASPVTAQERAWTDALCAEHGLR